MNDNLDETGYNSDNNVNDQWSFEKDGSTLTGEVVEKIDRSNLRPITVPGCTHANRKRDPNEETDEYYAEVCLDCPVGFLVKKS